MDLSCVNSNRPARPFLDSEPAGLVTGKGGVGTKNEVLIDLDCACFHKEFVQTGIYQASHVWCAAE